MVNSKRPLTAAVGSISVYCEPLICRRLGLNITDAEVEAQDSSISSLGVFNLTLTLLLVITASPLIARTTMLASALMQDEGQNCRFW